MQKSVLFYRVSQNDTALEVMCESGYGYACGIKGINATLSIPTRINATPSIPTIDTQPGNLCFSNESCNNYIHSLDEICIVFNIIMNKFPL